MSVTATAPIERLDPSFIAPYKTAPVPWGPLGYITFKSRYARWRDADGNLDPAKENRHHKEEWWETVERCVNGILKLQAKASPSAPILDQEDAERLFDMVFNLKCTFPGRGLWQLGTKYVDRNGQDSLQNCWHVAIDDPVESFAFLFDELMMGGGVGFNIHPRHVYEMPKVAYNPVIERQTGYDVDLIVADNREGWVRLLKRVLSRFFYTGRKLTFSTDCVRSKGAPIKGFGGTASGPEELVRGTMKIVEVLRSRYRKKLRPIDCLDICNIIGSIVVAGNVRRSAQIALGKKDDVDYLMAKNWEAGEIPPHRGMSNNSVLVEDIDELPRQFWDGYAGTGEPYGMVNLGVCQNYGRIADGKGYRTDPRVIGVNPCGEITLESYESCNLFEIFFPNCTDEEFIKAAELGYKCTKIISTVPAIYDKTNEVLRRNRRLGVGVSGLLQDRERLTKKELFDQAYKHLEALDDECSMLLGVNRSIKLTTIKPSGTVSLLPGVTPGVHPAYSRYYIRRINLDTDSPLVKVCREAGYHVEPRIQLDGSRDLKTMVVSFPVESPANAVLAKEMTAIQQLEFARFMQTWWSDNSVSVTVYYKKKELPAIKAWLKEHWNAGHMKTVSFLLHSDHGFKQAPYEEISSDRYEELAAKARPISRVQDVADGNYEIDDPECRGGVCPIR